MGRLFDDLDDLDQDRTLPGEGEPHVLVAVMNDPHALEIARAEGWYRIPLKRAPPRVGADYLAFYQTGAFGPQERWKVNYYAPIRRYRIVRRRDLLPEENEHPRADDKYFKIEIGALEALPRPIPSRRLRRITFIPTTLKKLLEAEEINDLWSRGQAEEELWASFKREGIPAERQVRMEEGEKAYRIDFALYCRDGRVAVIYEGSDFGDLHLLKESPAIADYELRAAGWTPLRIRVESPEECLEKALTKIRRLVEKLGGTAS